MSHDVLTEDMNNAGSIGASGGGCNSSIVSFGVIVYIFAAFKLIRRK